MPASDPVVPEITNLNRGFWEAAAREELALQKCASCGWLRYPIAEVCPCCLSPSAQWTSVSGRAKLVSWTFFHQIYNEAWRERAPYNVALVELVEGPRLVSNLELEDGAALSVGMPLEVRFVEVAGVKIPRFAPTDRKSVV